MLWGFVKTISFIYLCVRLAASGLGRGRRGLRCRTRDLPLRGAGFSLVVAVGLVIASGHVGSSFLDQGLNPRPLRWKVDS